MHQVTRAAAKRAAQAASGKQVQQRFVNVYKQRFTAVTKGLGMQKQDALEYGMWCGECDASGLMKLWPVQKLNESDARRRVELFTSLAEKGFAKEAGVGKARALIQLGDYAAARASLPATSPADGKLHNVALSTRIAISVNELQQLKAVKEIDSKLALGSEGDLSNEINNLFHDLSELLPDDWEVAGAHGDFLLSRKDPAAVPKLEKAVRLANREAIARRGNNEVYISDKTSTGALSDYVDYKYQNNFRNGALAATLEPLTLREEPAMELLLKERYPGLTGDELLALLPLQVRVESAALGLISFVQEQAEVNVKPWNSVKALEADSLIKRYTGNALSGLKTHNDLTLEEEMARIESSTAVPSIEVVLETQKRVSVSLAEDTRDRIKISLAQARSFMDDHQGAVKVLNEVIGADSYLRMYDAFMARGNAYFELGQVDKAHKDHKTAFALEDAFVDRDIPTMDQKAYRNEF
eukprot:TRINITY_DN15420_c1_g1_i1.p2 TRINITY_DN15420_c1_g1~~TRINITY_DN15420_c1_g1_i1.p2  ORF type:complete len:469 (+),score=241.27 TRINITY_DN15420_c1_g1_i1:64-1470(+)